MKRTIAVVLHNLRSTHNVGSIFRTADAAGVNHIYLSGFTPAPLDRFGRPDKSIAKTALGAERFVPWSYDKEPRRVIERLKKNGFTIAGVEQDARAIDYHEFRAPKKIACVLGNEVRGLSLGMRKLCDVLIEIPMKGAMIGQAHHPRRTRRGKESLNVSVAAGIILFSL